MIAALDAAYAGATGCGACVLFNEWTASTPAKVVLSRADNVAAYAPGAFYKRELPVLLAALRAAREQPSFVIVDGYVWLGRDSTPGLGAHLHAALGGAAVIGVAKTRYRDDNWSALLLRGRATRPLYITAVGIDLEEAVVRIMSMTGKHRVPDLLRLADRRAREGVNGA